MTIVKYFCLIYSFVTVTDHAQPGTSYTISGLEPSTFYHLRITAYNKRGYTNTEYKVSTLTQDGGNNYSIFIYIFLNSN